MAATTTICIDPKVKDKLTSLKRYSRESYSSIVERLANMAIDDETLSDEAIRGIEEALLDIKNGRLHSEEDIMKEFDLK
jgi:predicted transcriptional regulator